MNQLWVKGVSVDAADRRIVDSVMFGVEQGEFVGLVGPNGSGKSSLLRTIYRVLKPMGGAVLHLGDDVWRLPAREAARRMAVVAQERTGEFDFTVRELVAMGRMPHKAMLSTDGPEDRAIVARCLDTVGMGHCAGRSFSTLSGGEKQRVLVARALAQEAPFLVLDEPTNHLDIRHQLDLLTLVRRLGTTTLAALHDLNLAARYCHRLVMLAEGKVVAIGSPAEVLTAERIGAVYGVGATVRVEEGVPRIEFYPL